MDEWFDGDGFVSVISRDVLEDLRWCERGAVLYEIDRLRSLVSKKKKPKMTDDALHHTQLAILVEFDSTCRK